jgi:hypothetical protein
VGFHFYSRQTPLLSRRGILFKVKEGNILAHLPLQGIWNYLETEDIFSF